MPGRVFWSNSFSMYWRYVKMSCGERPRRAFRLWWQEWSTIEHLVGHVMCLQPIPLSQVSPDLHFTSVFFFLGGWLLFLNVHVVWTWASPIPFLLLTHPFQWGLPSLKLSWRLLTLPFPLAVMRCHAKSSRSHVNSVFGFILLPSLLNQFLLWAENEGDQNYLLNLYWAYSLALPCQPP